VESLGWADSSGRDPLEDAFGVTLVNAVQREIRQAGDRIQREVREELRRVLGQDAQSADGGTGSSSPYVPRLQHSSSFPEQAPRLPSPVGAQLRTAADVRQKSGPRFAAGIRHFEDHPPPAMQLPQGCAPSLFHMRSSGGVDDADQLPGMVPVPENACVHSKSSLSVGFLQASGPDNMSRQDSEWSYCGAGDTGLLDEPSFLKRFTYAERVSQKLRRKRIESKSETSPRKSRLTDTRAELLVAQCGEKRRRSNYRAFVQGALYETQRESTTFAVVNRLRWFLMSDFFDYTMGAVLLANAALLGYQANFYARAKFDALLEGQGTEPPITFKVLDLSFCGLFVLELAARLYISGKAFFKAEGRKWNVFDMFIVFFQVLDEFVKWVFKDSSVQEHFSNVGVIRMLRLARLMRLVRMVRLIPELKSMVYLIYASIGSFVWSLMLILIMMYCYSIYYTEIVTDMVTEGLVLTEEMPHAEATWGNLLVSVLTLWMAISGGDDWRNFTDVLKRDNLYGLHVCLFVMYIAFGTLVMLNLVTGVFVESAQRIMKEDKDAELVAMASKIFLATDVDGSSEISYDEFQNQMERGGMQEYVKAIGIGEEELSHLYELLDQDDSGTVNAGEFIKGCLRLRGPARALDLAEMEYQMRESFHTLTHAVAQIGKIVARGSTPGVRMASAAVVPVFSEVEPNNTFGEEVLV